MRNRLIRSLVLVAASLAVSLAWAQTKLDVWVYDSLYSDNAPIVQAADAFMKANPDIKVNLIPTQYGSDSYLNKYVVANQAGSGPDAVMVDVAWSPQLAAMGAAAPLDSYLGRGIDNYFAGPVETVTYKGEVYGLPFYTNDLQLIYNKTAFENAGLPLPHEGWTWADFKHAVETLSNGKMYGFGLEGGWGGSYEFYPWMWQNGGKFLTDDNSKPAFDSAAGLEAAKFYLGIVSNPKYVPEAAKTWKGWSELGTAFSHQVIAMFEVGDWGLPVVEKMKPSFDWGVAPLPMQKQKASLVGGANWIINPNSKHQDAAYKWISYVTGPAVFKMMDGYNRIAARKGAADQQQIIKNDPRMKVFVDGLDYAHPRPAVPQWTNIDYNCIQPAFLKVILKGAKVDAAMSEASTCAAGILGN